MKKYYAGREPKYTRNTPETYTKQEVQEAFAKLIREHRKTRKQGLEQRFYEQTKNLPKIAAKGARIFLIGAGTIGTAAAICIGTAYAVYWTASQAYLWLSAQTWIKPVVAIAVVSAGIAGAIQYSRDRVKQTEADRGQRTGGHHPGHGNGQPIGTGKTIIIYQNQDKT